MRDYNKTARERIRQYIISNYCPESYEGTRFFITTNSGSFEDVARSILEIYNAEKPYTKEYMERNRISSFESFLCWCQGLPSVLDTCYFYNRSAVDDVAKLLEEPESVAKKYSETAAERYLTNLIYRELTAAYKGII